MGYLSESELKEMGLQFGANVLISEKCSIYGGENISIADNVRVDDFCVLSAVNGFIKLGSHVHVAPYCGLYGGGGIEMGDFSGISSGSSLYSTNDNYSGDFLIGPTMFEDYRCVDARAIVLSKYVTVGTHSAVLPGVVLGEGSVLGAFSLAHRALDPWYLYSGVPAKKLRKRKNGLIDKADMMSRRWAAQKIVPC